MPDFQDLAAKSTILSPVELTIRDHYGQKTHCVLHTLPAIVGRDESADVLLMDPWISHRHCEIDRIGDVLVVRDLDSKNGIFMHGHRVREAQVLSGDELTVARTKIIVHYHGRTPTVIETEAAEPKKQRPPQNHGPETVELFSRGHR